MIYFEPSELDVICALGDTLIKCVADPFKSRAPSRLCKLAWIPCAAETEWLYRRAAQCMNVARTQLKEPFQYTVYDEPGAFFDWHTDSNRSSNRKWSMSLQLSDPADYEGCALQLNMSECASKERGAVIVFSSLHAHRVTRLISGVRKSLVVWAAP